MWVIFSYCRCGHISLCCGIKLKTMVLDKVKRQWCRCESFQGPVAISEAPCPKDREGRDSSEIPSLPASRTLWQAPKQEENHSYTILLGFSSLYRYYNSQNTSAFHLEYSSPQTTASHISLIPTSGQLSRCWALLKPCSCVAILRRHIFHIPHPSRHWLF